MEPGVIEPLRREDVPSETLAMARFLIGKTLVLDHDGKRLSGRIVETEAYPPGDAAGRAFTGESAANRSLYLDYGHAFVYLIYGLYHLLNVVSEPQGVGAAVLLRALEPLDGIPSMVERRGTCRLRELARGPGRLATALGIDKHYDGIDLFGHTGLWLGQETRPTGAIASSRRIGLTKEAHRQLRYYEADNPFVSGPRRLDASHDH